MSALLGIIFSQLWRKAKEDISLNMERGDIFHSSERLLYSSAMLSPGEGVYNRLVPWNSQSSGEERQITVHILLLGGFSVPRRGSGCDEVTFLKIFKISRIRVRSGGRGFRAEGTINSMCGGPGWNPFAEDFLNLNYYRSGGLFLPSGSWMTRYLPVSNRRLLQSCGFQWWGGVTESFLSL